MLHQFQSWMRRFDIYLAILAGSLSLTALLLNFQFYFLEANLYDLRMSRGFQSTPNSEIVLIAIDDKTIKELHELSPLPLELHTQILEMLEKANPLALGFLADLNHIRQANPLLFHQRWISRFLASAKRMQSNGTQFLIGTAFDVTGEVPPPAQLNTLPYALAVIHKDGNVFSEDKITRRALLSLYGKPSFHLELARSLGYLGQNELPRGAFYVPEVAGEYFFFRYHGNTSLSSETHSDHTYTRYSFVDILKQRVPIGSFTNKIVLIGTVSSDDSSDFAATPYSKSAFTNPKLIVHANILDSLLNKDGIIRAPSVFNWLVTFLVTTSVLWWIMKSTPLIGVFATLSLALALIVVSQTLFQFQGIWLRESQPLVGIFVSYYLAVPYRLIQEFKKRWEYQKKNELLTQVEELKTNFLNLVTHDLKTPVARIQGLAELILRKKFDPSSVPFTETIRHIIASTEELNRFITSILELSKVESNHIHFHFESKDINQLIERSIEGFQAQAKSRRISVQAHLEPLFPIKIDPSLISKVLNNLIDNAIKYSPTDAMVKVESKEVDNWIVISIQDQGIGMTSEEQENLFTRFYRAKNDTTTAIAGTGLGLYLTKYFIEAHRGRVEVQSEKNKGSTFKIYLPLDENPSTHKTYSSLNLTQSLQIKEHQYVQNPSR